MRRIDWLVIHTAATRPGMDIGVEEIRRWHKKRGFKDIGYHYVIRRDGTIEEGRPVRQSGAHVKGHNRNSIGICLVGGVNDNLVPENNYTPAQWRALEALLKTLSERYPKANVTGHRDFPRVNKACPCFDAEPWAYKKGFKVKGKRRQVVEELKKSKTLVGSAVATSGTALGVVGEGLQDTASEVSLLSELLPYFGILAVLLTIAGIGLVVYSRIKDANRNPKFIGPAE